MTHTDPTPNRYASPDVLVETAWLADHLHEANWQVVELSSKQAVYEDGHIPGALWWDWRGETQDSARRNVPDKTTIERLLGRYGITAETTLLFYGDRNNILPTYAFWILTCYGHYRVRILNGGRRKWVAEGRPLSKESPPPRPPTVYQASDPHFEMRARRDFVLQHLADPQVILVDARSAKEYTGELVAPEYLPQEGALRAGHIPGAVNISWGSTMHRDGTFKTAAELAELYHAQGVTADKEAVVYCRVGERSAHSWFVLRHLLGYPRVRNYDGSWVEWGNLVDVPIARSEK